MHKLVLVNRIRQDILKHAFTCKHTNDRFKLIFLWFAYSFHVQFIQDVDHQET